MMRAEATDYKKVAVSDNVPAPPLKWYVVTITYLDFTMDGKKITNVSIPATTYRIRAPNEEIALWLVTEKFLEPLTKVDVGFMDKRGHIIGYLDGNAVEAPHWLSPIFDLFEEARLRTLQKTGVSDKIIEVDFSKKPHKKDTDDSIDDPNADNDPSKPKK